MKQAVSSLNRILVNLIIAFFLPLHNIQYSVFKRHVTISVMFNFMLKKRDKHLLMSKSGFLELENQL